MKIDFTEFTGSLSTALDYAEKALLNVKPHHGLRVAAMTRGMAEYLGFDADVVFSLTQAALLHDCALSEYLKDELSGVGHRSGEVSMAAHCVAGEEILKKLPFYERVQGAVLYHHERADGSGALRKKAFETPVYGQLVHIADAADVHFTLYSCDKEKYERLRAWIRKCSGTVFSEECADAFLNGVSYELIESVSGTADGSGIREMLEAGMIDVSVDSLRDMSSVFAEIADYKSHFTWRHSMGVAEKAETMGGFYCMSDDDRGLLYIAGALHDAGKLLISNDILEKPGRLSPEEYREIQNHAVGTWDMLSRIAGMEDICRWAALHHEKLDGSGYPFGYTGERLDRNSRLMACLDIYQALVEDRPYKTGMKHDEAMKILRKMGDAGQLDSGIIDDIDSCFSRAGEVGPAGGGEAARYEGTGTAFRCPVCGYVLNGELPEDFICPLCEQPGSIFEKIS